MKKILTAIIVLAVIAVIAVLAYQNFYLTPERVTKTAIEKLLSAKSHHQATTVTIDGTFRGNPGSAKISIIADSDMADQAAPKSSGVFDGSLQLEGLQVSGAVEFKLFKDNVYLRLVKLPAMLNELKSPFDVSKYKEQWIKIPVAKYKGLMKKQPETPQVQAEEKKTEAQAQQALQDVKKWSKENKIFSKIEKLKPETIEGVNCYHYMATLNKEALIELFKILNETSGNKVTPEEIAKTNEGIRNMKDILLELWVGKSGFYLHKIKSSPIEVTPSMTGEKINLAVEALYSKYNEQFIITEPENSVDVEEIVKEIMSGFGLQKPGGHPMPNMPAMPQIPGMPNMPNMPQMPQNMPMPAPVPTQ